MAILQECPICHTKQSLRNSTCKCGENLAKAKRSKRLKYWISYYVSGKQRREVVGVSIEEARDAEGKRRSQKRENRIFDIKPDTKMIFQELAEWYLAIEEIKGKASYRQMVYRVKLLNQEIGNKIISDIIPVDLQNYREKRRKKGIALATIDDEITQAKMIVNKAFQNKLISSDTLMSFRNVKKLLKQNANARDRVLSTSEFDSLLANAETHIRPILLTAYWTGLRKGEILKLTWNKVDLKKRLITLEAEDTKTREPRKAPIPEPLHDALCSMPRAIHDNHVFLYKGKPIKDIITSLKTACKKAGIVWGKNKEGGFIFHDLRHTANDNMREAGIDQLVRMHITGHKTDVMDRRYSHVKSRELHQAADRLNNFLQNIDHSVDQASSLKS